MNKNKIIITDKGNINIPSEVKMTIMEIADLFGVFYQTTKKEIRAIEKLGIAVGSVSPVSEVDGNNVHPTYYGFEMIIAVSFQIQSLKSDLFRKWIVKKVLKKDCIDSISQSV